MPKPKRLEPTSQKSWRRSLNPNREKMPSRVLTTSRNKEKRGKKNELRNNYGYPFEDVQPMASFPANGSNRTRWFTVAD